MGTPTAFEARCALLGDVGLSKATRWLQRQIDAAAPSGKDIIMAVEALEAVHPVIRDGLKEYFRSDIYLDEGEIRLVLKEGRVGRSFVLMWDRRKVYTCYLA